MYELLYRLGLRAESAGFFYVVRAVMLASRQPERLLFPSCWLYPVIAGCYNCSAAAVELGIKCASQKLWRQNRHALEQLAGRKLEHPPNSGELIALLAIVVRGKRAA